MPRLLADKLKAARSRIGAMKIAPCSGIASSQQAAKEFEEAINGLEAALRAVPSPDTVGVREIDDEIDENALWALAGRPSGKCWNGYDIRPSSSKGFET